MALLEFVDLLVDLLLGILHRLTDLVSPLVCLVGCGVVVRLLHLFGSLFKRCPTSLFQPLYFAQVGLNFVSSLSPSCTSQR
jgi:hypothetical protein